jgi:hypothetical protein
MTQEKGPAVVAGPAVCPGSGEWAGYGWNWRPCPECGARIDVDESTLCLVAHEKIEDWLRARKAAAV